MLRDFVRWFWPKRALFTVGILAAVVLATLGIEYDNWVLNVLSTALAVLSVGLLVKPGVRRRGTQERKPDHR